MEVGLRQQAFTKIIKQVQYNWMRGIDECEMQKVFSKFSQEQIKQRDAFSAGPKDKVSDGSWEAEGDNLNSGTTQWADDVKRFIRERRYSWPLLQEVKREITTNQFENQLDLIANADEDYLIDNCGREVKQKPVADLPKSKKMVSRRTQTYLKELLQIDGLEANDSEQSIIMEDDAEIDEAFA